MEVALSWEVGTFSEGRYPMVRKAAAVAPNVLSAQCPTRAVLDLIADKWTTLVIYLLSQGTKRYGQLQREIGGISQKMLTQTLRQLEEDGRDARGLSRGPAPDGVLVDPARRDAQEAPRDPSASGPRPTSPRWRRPASSRPVTTHEPRRASAPATPRASRADDASSRGRHVGSWGSRDPPPPPQCGPNVYAAFRKSRCRRPRSVPPSRATTLS